MAVNLHDAEESPRILKGLRAYVNDNKNKLEKELVGILKDNKTVVCFPNIF